MRSLRGLSIVGLQLTSRLAHSTNNNNNNSSPSSSPRSAALSRWSAAAAPPPSTPSDAAPNEALLGKGMKFAAGLVSRTASTRKAALSSSSSADHSTVADVKWDLCERMDYYLQYCVPANWKMVEMVKDNSVSIQCSPPPLSSPAAGVSSNTIHGISINCFAYKRRVTEPDCGKLLHVFLKRFNASVGNSLQMLSECVATPPSSSPQPPSAMSSSQSEGPDNNISDLLARRLNCAVAEITFTAAPGQPLAHGLCRAFFNSNGRFHYVVVVAVPEEEYEASKDLLIHSLVAVVESRVEAAAKRT